MSAADKRREALEVKPKINLALKLQVTKQDLKTRPHYQEVAEFFEELLCAAEKGLDVLPPRLNRAPGQVHNEAKELKKQKIEEEKEIRELKEEKRKYRDEQLKELIEQGGFKDKSFKKQKIEKKKALAEEKEKEMKSDRKKF
jgi:hypothetical protein